MLLLRLWRIGTILLIALLQGLAFAHLLERPAKLQYDAALYITLQKTLYVQWGPPHIGGVLEPAAIVATLILAYLLRNDRGIMWITVAAGVMLLLAFPVVFFWLVAPANEAFPAAIPARVPADWMQLRVNWEMGHVIRFLLQFAALSLLVVSLSQELDRIDTGRDREPGEDDE
jgi:hypothetical protein